MGDARALGTAFVLACALAPGGAASAANAVVPAPARVEPAAGRMPLDADFTVDLKGPDDGRAARAVGRFLNSVASVTGIPVRLRRPRGSEPALLEIRFDATGAPVQELHESEEYELEVSPTAARLSARNPLGVIRGLATLLQLLDLDRSGFGFPALKVRDAPRFPWRGLLIDPARHFLTVDSVKRTIDAMALVKLNVLHWHLSDDQGFRLESRRFPKLHSEGSDGLYYTQAEIADVVAYARDRGIRVVPELDVPGHVTSWLVGHPELGSLPGPYAIERGWGIFDPAMDPSREAVFELLDGLFAEVAGLFPDAFVHAGGDEVNGRHWEASPAVQAFAKRHGMGDRHEVQAVFSRRVAEILRKHGRRMVGWDEVLHADLPPDAVVEVYRGRKTLAESVRKGHSGLLAWWYYMDFMWSAERHYLVEPLDEESAGLSLEEQKRVLGGEASMWSEYVTEENLDSRLWPRAAAVAERLWSPRETRDVENLYVRLEALSRLLDLTGAQHLSGPRRMRRRLCKGCDEAALEVLVRVVEPVKLYERSETRAYRSSDPLNRLVDTAAPESLAARELMLHAAAVTTGSPGRREGLARLREEFALWRDNHERLLPAIRGSALLAELEPLSEDLGRLGKIGARALDHLDSGTPPPEEWLRESQGLVASASRPVAELLNKGAPVVGVLLEELAGSASRPPSR